MEASTVFYPACDIYSTINDWLDALEPDTQPCDLTRGDVGTLNTAIRQCIQNANPWHLVRNRDAVPIIQA